MASINLNIVSPGSGTDFVDLLPTVEQETI
jgi:hypothetical protein